MTVVVIGLFQPPVLFQALTGCGTSDCCNRGLYFLLAHYRVVYVLQTLQLHTKPTGRSFTNVRQH